MLPARIVENPALRKMCSINDVVVVFPFDPVIPIRRPFRKRLASSTSLQIVTPFARADWRRGASAGTPGLGIIKSAPRMSSCRWPPNSRPTPAFRRGAIESPSSFSDRASVAVTRAPRAAQNNAVASPDLARPTTSTRLFRSSMDADILVAESPTSISTSSEQTMRKPTRRSRSARSPWIRSSPAVRNDDEWAPCEKCACRAV